MASGFSSSPDHNPYPLEVTKPRRMQIVPLTVLQGEEGMLLGCRSPERAHPSGPLRRR
jgi:hypothetical protein